MLKRLSETPNLGLHNIRLRIRLQNSFCVGFLRLLDHGHVAKWRGWCRIVRGPFPLSSPSESSRSPVGSASSAIFSTVEKLQSDTILLPHREEKSCDSEEKAVEAAVKGKADGGTACDVSCCRLAFDMGPAPDLLRADLAV
ncbi:hypothetical protein EYZ11_005047 [Aspergillus tanneri]|uniref:Uncharacterized protein n=1 Tax=Aspergillus tanneri TaxID=1220188 RepID=A0A4S3JJD9_9EURO|nr:hypothetical protein EYZ11_005047 [Aspergillus tanneri]